MIKPVFLKPYIPERDLGNSPSRCDPNYGFVSIAKGQLSRGISILEDQIRIFFENDSRYRYATAKYMLGRVYLHIFQRSSPLDLSALIKNIGFIVRNVPFASKKAEHHFNKAIEVAKEIGASGTLGQAYLDLGRLHIHKHNNVLARNCILEAIRILERNDAEGYLNQAREALASLEK